LIKTCPNCGAPISSFECKYCGATFYDFANLSFDKPVYIRYRGQNGEVMLMKSRLTSMSVDMSSTQTDVMHLGFNVQTIRRQPEMYLSADFIQEN